MPSHLPLAATLLSAFAVALTAQTSCAPQWAPGFGVPGASAAIHACTSWDPDGPGPATPRLVIGGDFATASTVRTNRIAQFDPATGNWSTMAGGVGGGSVGVGFGVSSGPQAAEVAAYADLVVVGSALVRAIHEAGPRHGAAACARFVGELRKAIDEA